MYMYMCSYMYIALQKNSDDEKRIHELLEQNAQLDLEKQRRYTHCICGPTFTPHTIVL